MRKKIEWQPEILDAACWRVKVIGGWLVGHSTHEGKRITSESMAFVADRDHEWIIIPPFDPSVTDKAQPTVNPSDFETPKLSVEKA